MNDNDRQSAADKKIEAYSKAEQSANAGQNPSEDSTGIQVQEISLPKGGGAISGMGESFRADEFTGTANLSIPLTTSPCRDFEPQLELNYVSVGGNGTFGLGFDLGLPRIGRKTTTGVPRYTDQDSYIGPGGETLIVVSGSERQESLDGDSYSVIGFQPRIENSFMLLEQWQNQKTLGVFWKTVDKSNVTSVYGKTPAAQIFDPDHPERVYQWLLEFIYEPKGSCRHYIYKAENSDNVAQTIWENNRSETANKYIQHIYYGNTTPYVANQPWPETYLFDIAFDYGEYDLADIDENHGVPVRPWASRPDSFSHYAAGFEIRTHRLCRGVLMFHCFSELGSEPVLISATTFGYQQSTTLSLLNSAQMTGYRLYSDSYSTQSQPALLLTYSDFKPRGGDFVPMERQDDRALAGVLRAPNYNFVDLYGEGLPGVLYADQQSVMYFSPEAAGKDSRGVDYSQPLVPAAFPLPRAVNTSGIQLMDLDGDGHLDLLVSGPDVAESGYYKVQSDGDWKNYLPLQYSPTVMNEPDNQFVDLVNNGLADIVQVQPEQLRLYTNKAGQGFNGPIIALNDQALPSQRQGDSQELWTFVDILGGGTQCLVRITSGRIQCWPGVGYGQFAEPILFGNAPDFNGELNKGLNEKQGQKFDSSRLFIADLDGNGLPDLIYGHDDHAAIYLNQSGNQFADPIRIALPTPWTQISQVSFADVYGKGAAAMVISNNDPAPQHWAYDFIQESKPYLLIATDNQLGLQTSIDYKPSTHYYLEDKAKGIDWLTRLPFPVQVVAASRQVDSVSGTVQQQTYSYRHGYFDPVYREFRGFGYVQRQDAEALSLNSQPYDVPPLITRSWYHTGVYDLESYYLQLSEEFYQGDTQAYLMPDSEFVFRVQAPLASDWSAAHRGLKGQLLHRELYAPLAPVPNTQAAAGELADAPYTVSSYRYKVTQLQVAKEGSAGIYATHQLESVDYNYQRNPTDPVLRQRLVLAVDAFGQMLKACEIAYPRRSAKPNTVAAQLQLKTTCQVQKYVPLSDIEGDTYLPSLLQQQQAYSIDGLALAPSQLVFSWAEVDAAINAALAGNSVQYTAQLFQWQRLQYQETDQQKITPQGLLIQQPEAVFDKDIIKALFQKVLDATELTALLTQGGYLLESDYWWNPGLSQTYAAGTAFYQIEITTDMFSAATNYQYDKYNLLLTQTTDALANTTAVQSIDYQSLAAISTLDINGNTNEVRYDPLGQVYTSSFYGSEKGIDVGFAPLSNSAPVVPPNLQALLDNPQTYLQGAASYTFYDLSTWSISGTPIYSASVKADNFPSKSYATKSYATNSYATNSSVEIDIIYSDGSGRELQSKTKVNPGEAYNVDGNKVTKVDTTNRWLNSGRKVYNNKGKTVKAFDPVYLDTSDYIDTAVLDTFVVAATTFYDPLEREIRVDTAKGFFTQTVYTPWEIAHYDSDDTVKDSPYYKANINNPELNPFEKKALQQAALFYDTPSTEVLDNFSRTVQKRDINTLDGTDPQTYINDFVLDIQGNVLQSADARLVESNIYNFTNAYSLTGELLNVIGVDSGALWSLNNAMGNPLYSNNSRGFAVNYDYDLLQRRNLLTVTGGDSESPLNNIVEKYIYGESQTDPEKNNLRGRIYQQYDQAGLLQYDSYNLQQKPLTNFRQLRAAYKTEANWIGTLSALLLPEQYNTQYAYDALQRVVAETDADGNQYLPEYYPGGQLSRITVSPGTVSPGTSNQVYVDSIHYTAAGQRLSIDYGNGVQTQYLYETTTQRLTNVNTTRLSDKKLLQALWYVYDPVGNITHCNDGAWDSIFNNQQKVDPSSNYIYDALYRLITGSGREQPVLAENPYRREGNYPAAGYTSFQDGQQLSNYSRQYQYDKAGNLQRMQHQGAQNFTYDYSISNSSNRSVEKALTDDPTKVDSYFDANGNQTQLVSVSGLSWNYRNNLAQATVIDRSLSSADSIKEPDGEYYVYDADGNRVRKVCERYGNGNGSSRIEQTAYLGNLQIYQVIQNSSLIEERHSKPIFAGDTKIAMRLQWLVGNPPQGVSNPQSRYTLNNNLGSAVLELDSSGKIISYEEYYPFGGTSVIAGNNYAEVKLNQYRYSGKENDSVTGLYYYGARYYAPWKCRWLSPDPSGAVDGLNLYLFVNNNPIAHVDTNGRWLIAVIQNNLGTVMTVIGVGTTLAGAPWAGVIINAGLAYSQGGSTATGIATQLAVGMIGGYVAGPLAGRAARQLGLAAGSASSFIFQGTLAGAISGSVTGGTMAKFQQLSSGRDHPASQPSIIQGIAYGGFKGAVSGALFSSTLASYKYLSSPKLSPQDQSAVNALDVGNPQSIKDNLEYGGFVYKKPDGSYGYTNPLQGTDQGFNPGNAIPLVPGGSNIVGDYHTHGDYSLSDPITGAAIRTGDPTQDAFNSDHFSAPDIRGITADGIGTPEYVGYLGTPSGIFRAFNPGTGSHYVISTPFKWPWE